MPLSVHAPHVHGHHRRMSLNSRCLLLFFSTSLSIARHTMLWGGFKKIQRTDSFFTSRKFRRRITTWGRYWWGWNRWVQRLVPKLVCWCWSNSVVEPDQGNGQSAQLVRPRWNCAECLLQVLSHIISQLRPGADLSRVVLPTFILEPRSMLERITK